MKGNYAKHSTLCWDCDKACGKCSWSKELKPVKGWKAVPTKVKNGFTTFKGTKNFSIVDSFDVYDCPEFEVLKINNKEELKKMMKRNSEFLHVFKKVLELY